MYVHNAIKHHDYGTLRQFSELYIGSSIKSNDVSNKLRRCTDTLSRFFDTSAGAVLLKLGAATFLFGVLALLNSLIFASMGF